MFKVNKIYYYFSNLLQSYYIFLIYANKIAKKCYFWVGTVFDRGRFVNQITNSMRRILLILLAAGSLMLQAATQQVTCLIMDADSSLIFGAKVTNSRSKDTLRTGCDGRVIIDVQSRMKLQVEADGYEARSFRLTPSDKGKRLRIYYITQVSVKPPTFVMFINDKKLTHFSYTRYIENQIRQTFGFAGTPIRFIYRERKEK